MQLTHLNTEYSCSIFRMKQDNSVQIPSDRLSVKYYSSDRLILMKIRETSAEITSVLRKLKSGRRKSKKLSDIYLNDLIKQNKIRQSR